MKKISQEDNLEELNAHEKLHAAVAEAARIWAEAGWPVIPLRPHDDPGKGAGKAPIVQGWQNRRAASPREVADWLAQRPDMNLGLVLGQASGLVGIDVDGSGGERVLLEMSAGKLPATWRFSTPGGGMRYLYSLPAGFTSRSRAFPVVGEEHQECGFLAEGKQTVIPPSIGPNGGVYTWAEGCSPDEMGEAAVAPSWLLSIIATEQKPEEAVLERLAGKCSVFSRLLQEQRGGGTTENDWFHCISLLVSAGEPEAARTFSSLSQKHDQRSEKRIGQLIAEGRPGMVRCSTMGCSEEQIARCHEQVRRNESGEATNSPGIPSSGRRQERPTGMADRPAVLAVCRATAGHGLPHYSGWPTGVWRGEIGRRPDCKLHR